MLNVKESKVEDKFVLKFESQILSLQAKMKALLES